MDRTRLDRWLARIVSALLIAILVTAPLAFGALRHQDFFWVQVLGILAASIWLVRLWLNRQPIFLPPIIWPLAAFCLYAVIRYFTSDVEYLARKELVRVLFYMMFFVLALNHFREIKVADIGVSILILVGMALSVYALRQYLTGTSAVWNLTRPGYGFRGSGTFIYPNHFAGFAEMLLALGLGYVFVGTTPKWVRGLLAYCSLWLLLGVYVSFSRAGWVVTIGSLLVLLPVFLRNRQRQVIAFTLFVALLIAGLTWELKTREITTRLGGLTGDHPSSGFSVRGVLWRGAYQIWRKHPLWGGGPGHFDERFRQYRTPFFQATAGHAHCDYLNVLADWGAIGAGLLGGALALYVWPLGRNWIKTVLDPTGLNAATTNYFALTCGGFAGTLALLAHSLVDYQWYAPGVMLTFIAIVAMLICQTQPGRWNFAAGLPVSILLMPLVVFQAVEASKAIREHQWLAKANRATTVDARISNLRRAFSIEARNFQTAYSIGESYRMWSWEGAEGYERLAEEAIQWFDRAARLNRLDPYPPMRKAMCLDWLKRHSEAEMEIQKALALDPEHYLVLGIAGWHYYQTGDDAKSIHYMTKSHDRNSRNNPIVGPYFRLLGERLQTKGK
jgi:O-antigen ligase